MKKYIYDYPRPALTVDMMVTRNVGLGTEILLIQRLNPPFQNQWALPGGFVDMDETLEQAAARELEEETGLTGIVINQFKAFSTPGRDPRGHTISVIFIGEASQDSSVKAGDDAKYASWFSLKELPSLAFDHADIIQEAFLNR